MIIKSLFFIILLAVSSYANDKLFIVNKDFATTKQVVEEALSKTSYEVKQTNDKILKIYFDSPELFYLKKGGYICYEAVEYLSKKKKVKYQESIWYSIDSNSSYKNSVKHYKNVKTFEGKHPLLSLVKRKEREVFIERLKNDGIKYPLRLKKIVEVSKLVDTFTFGFNSIDFATISINRIEVSAFDSKTEFLMLKVYIDNVKLEKLSDSKKLEISSSLNKLVSTLIEELDIKSDYIFSNEYTISFEQMKKNVYLFDLMLRYPYLVNLMYAFGFTLSGLLIMFFLFRKRLKKT